MDSKAKLFILSSFMLDRKKILISFNFEKLRSPEATVTGIVSTTRKATETFGKTSCKQFTCKKRKSFSKESMSSGIILMLCNVLSSSNNARPSISELAVSHSVYDERSVCKLRHWVLTLLSALSLVSASVALCLTISNKKPNFS